MDAEILELELKGLRLKNEAIEAELDVKDRRLMEYESSMKDLNAANRALEDELKILRRFRTIVERGAALAKDLPTALKRIRT